MAFTQADVERDLYMELPKNFSVPGRVVPDYGPVGSGRPPPRETVGLAPPPNPPAAGTLSFLVSLPNTK